MSQNTPIVIQIPHQTTRREMPTYYMVFARYAIETLPRIGHKEIKTTLTLFLFFFLLDVVETKHFIRT